MGCATVTWWPLMAAGLGAEACRQACSRLLHHAWSRWLNPNSIIQSTRFSQGVPTTSINFRGTAPRIRYPTRSRTMKRSARTRNRADSHFSYTRQLETLCLDNQRRSEDMQDRHTNSLRFLNTCHELTGGPLCWQAGIPASERTLNASSVAS